MKYNRCTQQLLSQQTFRSLLVKFISTVYIILQVNKPHLDLQVNKPHLDLDCI